MSRTASVPRGGILLASLAKGARLAEILVSFRTLSGDDVRPAIAFAAQYRRSGISRIMVSALC